MCPAHQNGNRPQAGLVGGAGGEHLLLNGLSHGHHLRRQRVARCCLMYLLQHPLVSPLPFLALSRSPFNRSGFRVLGAATGRNRRGDAAVAWLPVGRGKVEGRRQDAGGGEQVVPGVEDIASAVGGTKVAPSDASSGSFSLRPSRRPQNLNLPLSSFTAYHFESSMSAILQRRGRNARDMWLENRFGTTQGPFGLFQGGSWSRFSNFHVDQMTNSSKNDPGIFQRGPAWHREVFVQKMVASSGGMGAIERVRWTSSRQVDPSTSYHTSSPPPPPRQPLSFSHPSFSPGTVLPFTETQAGRHPRPAGRAG